MSRKFLPAIAAFLILVAVFGTTPISHAQAPTFAPHLEVQTIPQDDQMREKGVIILGLDPTVGRPATPQDVLSQHKILVTYNGLPIMWDTSDPGVTVACNVLEKDKVNVVPDPKDGTGRQGTWENAMTILVDVSELFACKVRWKHPANDPTMFESVGVLDVYFEGPYTGPYIADNILTVQVSYVIGHTIMVGAEIQDICVLGWAISGNAATTAVVPFVFITKPDGTTHPIWQNPLGNFRSCEDLALLQRNQLGIVFDTLEDNYSPLPSP